MTREIVLGLLGEFGGTLGFAILLGAPRKTVMPISLTALVGYGAYLALSLAAGRGMLISYFLSTVVITVLCEIQARVMRMPATVFLLCGLVFLAPGYEFYNAMLALVRDEGMQAAVSMMHAVQIVAAIAVGAAASSACARALTTRSRRGENRGR